MSSEKKLDVEGSPTRKSESESEPVGGDVAKASVKSIHFDGDDATEDLADQILRSRDNMTKTEARMNSLYRKYRECIEAFGSNLCYVAIGFLEWTDPRRGTDEKLYAPLLLVPVSLDRVKRQSTALNGDDGEFSLPDEEFPSRRRARSMRSAPRPLQTTAYRFTVAYDGEDIADNVALRLKLQSLPGGSVLPEFDAEDDRVDVETYFKAVERMIHRLPTEVNTGWRVVRGARLAIFTSAKEAMYRDLDPLMWKKTGLIGKEWIKAALHGREADPEHHINEEELTQAMHVTPVPTVVPSDSSQMKAIIRVVQRGQSIVIQGPPGTGKSQTITNLIASTLAAGRSVLFVAEKMAALSVVRQRLEETGLGRYCLELHSAKATPRQVLAQFGQRLAHQPVGTIAETKHSAPLQRLNLHRTALGSYGRAISAASGTLGTSFQESVWRQSQARHALELEMPEGGSEAGSLPALETDDDPGYHELAALHDATKVASQCIAEGVHLAAMPWRGTCPKAYPNSAIARTIRDILVRASTAVQHWQQAESAMPEPALWNDLPAAGWLAIQQGFTPPPPPPLPQAICHRIATNEASLAKYRRYVDAMQAWGSAFPEAARSLSEKSSIGDSVILSAAAAINRLDRALVSRLNTTSLTDLRSACEQVIWLKEALVQRASILDEIASIVKLKNRSEIFEDGTHLAESAHQLATLSPAVWRAMHTALLRPSANQQQRTAAEQNIRLQQTLATLKCHVRISSLPDEARWKELAYQLRLTGRGWFNWLPGTRGYKLRQELRAYFDKPLLDESKALSMIDRSLQWRREAATFAEDADHKTLLGPAFLGLDTDWETLGAALTTLSEWSAQFGVDATNTLIEHQDQVGSDTTQLTELANQIFKHQSGLMEIAVSLFHRQESTLRHLSEHAFLAEVLTQANEAEEILRDAEVVALPADTPTDAVPSLCKAALQLRGWKTEVSILTADTEFLGTLHQGMVGTDVSVVEAAVTWISELIQTPVLSRSIKVWLLLQSCAERTKLVTDAIASVCYSISGFQDELLKLTEVMMLTDDRSALSALNVARTSKAAKEEIEAALPAIDMLGPWFQLCQSEGEITKAGGAGMWKWCREQELASRGVECAVQLAFWNRVVAEFIVRHPELQSYHRQKLEGHRQGFCELDKEVGERLRRSVDHAIFRPANSAAPGRRQGSTREYTEMSLLRHELPKTKAHVPVRRLLKQSAAALKHLMPCWMMGPQAVAQFLEPEHIEFDLLVIDEASQVRPEDALGALARAKQIVIVGDSKQMPPTDVFRAIGAGDDDEIEDKDGEKLDVSGPALGLDSILDLYQAQLPSEMLRWHYRSQHQQLIAFSNEYFYDGGLIVPPSRWHEHPELGIRRHFVEDGRLQDRQNPAEAAHVVAIMREHVLREAPRPESQRETLGVVAMNSDHQSLIQDQWDAACKADPVLEEAHAIFIDGTKLFIRNLENVQGDERDVIIISTTYAKNAAGEMHQRFGPINKSGGWRRLNVLFTRARKRIHLVTSMVHTDVQVATTTEESGRGFFRKYLQFAETGHLPDTGMGIVKNTPDSPFEVSVAQCISGMGFDLHFQVGVQGFFIDIGVLHPDGDRYLCGIECDGAAYHSHPIARDRDRIRQEILEQRGWNIYRIWSTDWYRSRTLEIERLRGHLAMMVHRV